jgi:iron(III) transport system permease protein
MRSAALERRAVPTPSPRPLPWGLLIPSAITATVIAAPMVFLIARALGRLPLTVAVLTAQRTIGLLAATLALAGAASGLSLILGAGLAYLVERTDLPGRRFWRVALALPLAIPPYLGAIVFLHVFSRGGVLDRAIGVAIPPHGFAGAAAVVGLYTFPYSFLFTSAALRHASRTLDEVAQTTGRSSARIFWTVTLPLLRPAVGAGLFFPSLYALADFGTMVLLRYDTLGTELYYQLTAFFDRSAAAAIGLQAIVLTLGFLWIEARLRGKRRFHPSDASWRPPATRRLAGRKPAAMLAAGGILILTLVVPIALLAAWAYAGVVHPTDVERLWASGSGAWAAAIRSLLLAATASTVIIALAVPPAYLRLRLIGWPAWAIWAACQTGYALPGIAVVLAVAFLINSMAPWLYGTLPVMIGAFMVRYLSAGLRAVDSGLTQLPQRLGEAARGLGQRPAATFRLIDLPLLRAHLVAGWVLVFLNVLKDLPVSLLLRPPGFDTLPVRTWLSATDGIYRQAALPGLLLIAAAALPLVILLHYAAQRGIEVG